MEYKNWKKKAKQYLDSNSEDIDVICLLMEYQKRIMEFYTWLVTTVLEIHEKDLDEMKIMTDKHNELYTAFLSQIRKEEEKRHIT